MTSISASIGAILSDGWLYILLYICLASAMIVELTWENQLISRWLARTGALVLILFVGFRWETGTDWDAYIRVFFTNDTSADYDTTVFGIDLGYIIFNRIMYWISNDYTLFLLINSAFSISLVYIFIEKSTKYPCMGIFWFYTSYAVTHFMGSNRRMMAIGLVCVAFAYLREEAPIRRNWRRWLMPLAAAATIHRTSVATLPSLLVSRRAWPTIPVTLGLLACVGLGVSGAPFEALRFLGGVLSDYTGLAAIDKLVFYTSNEINVDANLDVTRQAILGVAKRSTLLVIFITYMHWQKPSGYAQWLYNMYIIGCALYFLMLGAPIFQIISTYYTIVEIVLLPIIFGNLPQIKVPYTLYLLTMPFLLLLSALIPYLELYVPYHSIFTTY